ncbi:MAG: ATP-binding cassette domain-containing protein [Deltaproteobacteria bacterium]|nr:ATP-binding cassette domain-containing protein [Deltaproteobacteria bacterium]
MIELVKLGVAFGEFALRDVSLRIGKGEYWVILGPSGCGKTVLMQTIAGFFSPDEGQIVVEGSDVTALPPERRRMGLVFQQAALFPHKTVRENIAYGLRARRASPEAVERTVGELVERLGLEPILGRPVPTLSGGEAQRVAVARALAIRPDLLLLDEPMSALDHNTRLELQGEMARIHKELRLTTLHVTHSREEAAALGDHIAVMLGGRIVQRGALADVVARPRCPFVARFLGLDPSVVAVLPDCAQACGARPGRCTNPESG